MKFIRSNHVLDEDDTLITFGIDEDGKVWLVTNSDGTAEGIETEYFGFSAMTFTDIAHSLVSLAFAALRYKLGGIHETDMVSVYDPKLTVNQDYGKGNEQ